MLQSDLLIVSKRKGELTPRYAKISETNLAIAQNLLDTYKNHIGEKKKHLKIIITELESKGFEYRFIRGVASLLDRKSTFICNCKINPVELRRKIFQTAQTQGIPTTLEKRRQIIEYVASEMKLNTEQVEEALYGDLEEELILLQVATLSPTQLLQEYNLSLTQTLLFSSTELIFNVSGNWQQTFFAIKRLGLIYEVIQENDFLVKIDGPANLFKLNRRYGTAIARLLPIIIANSEYSLSAKIFWKYNNEICNFNLDSKKQGNLFNRTRSPATKYDSIIEEKFAAQFKALNSNWTLKREPEPVKAGNQVIIPDFSLEKSNIKIYIEIMGFWTEGYLLRKIEKLKQVNNKMLLLVNEALACEKLSTLIKEKQSQLNLIIYAKKIPWAQVLHYLELAFEETKKKEIEFLKNLPIKFTEETITYEEFSNRIGISIEATKAALTTDTPKNYIALPNCLVRKEKLEKINTQLEANLPSTKKMPLLEAIKIIESQGITDATNVLALLNYKIIWQGIDSQQAQIIKTNN